MASIVAGAGLFVCRAIPLSFAAAECASDADTTALGYAVLFVALAGLLTARFLARTVR